MAYRRGSSVRSMGLDGRPRIPAISLHQPWAQLLILQIKRNETRHWRAPDVYLDRDILIHASKRPVHLGELGDELATICRDFLGTQFRTRLPMGCLLGPARLSQCLRMGDPPTRLAADLGDVVCGNWAPDRFAWLFSNPRPFSDPIPARGHQGFWWEDDPRLEAA
jgi:hypothetical protein